MIKQNDIEQAYKRIRSCIVEPPLRRSHTLSGLCGCDMLLKMDYIRDVSRCMQYGLQAVLRRRG